MVTDPVNVRSMAGPLKRVAMRKPHAILDADPTRWHYAKPIDAPALRAQYDQLVELLGDHGATVEWIDQADDGLADSIFTFDPSFIIGEGAVILAPGKHLRQPEADLHRAFYDQHNIPILGEIEAPGLIEGGDICWLDPSTLAVGRGFRTNQTGIDQLRNLVEPLGIDLVAFDLPYGGGPQACLHLLSVINPLDVDLALVYAPMVPAPLMMVMAEMGYGLLHIPVDEFQSSAGLCVNVLATAPRVGIAIAGFDKTRKLMTEAACEIATFEADELCLPCEGGPTCLTRPLLRT